MHPKFSDNKSINFRQKSKKLFGYIKIMLTFAIENNKYTKQWEQTFTKKSPATRDAGGKDTHLTTPLPTFWQVLTRTICILNLWTNMEEFHLPSGTTSISILRGHKFSNYVQSYILQEKDRFQMEYLYGENFSWFRLHHSGRSIFLCSRERSRPKQEHSV